MEAVWTLLQALVHGHGTMAQFDDPALGGRGQWMSGGMVMVGEMFNQALTARGGMAFLYRLTAPPAAGPRLAAGGWLATGGIERATYYLAPATQLSETAP